MLNETVREFSQKDWDTYAECYDALLYLTPYQQLTKEILMVIKLFVKNYNEVLDAGCGTGNLITQLHTELPSATLQGIDTSPSMLKRAKSKCKNIASIQQSDLNNPLLFNEASFDVITSINVLYAVNSPLQTLLEFKRLLRSGGKIVFTFPKKGYQNGIILKQHCQSTKPDEYWYDIHLSKAREEKLTREAIKDKVIVEQMLLVGEFNRNISQTKTFHFFDLIDLNLLIEELDMDLLFIKSVYANQAFLACIEKR